MHRTEHGSYLPVTRPLTNFGTLYNKHHQTGTPKLLACIIHQYGQPAEILFQPGRKGVHAFLLGNVQLLENHFAGGRRRGPQFVSRLLAARDVAGGGNDGEALLG